MADQGAERRQLTVMFSDLVGSTALSERLDPEELRQVILAYHEVSAAVIRRYEGHIAQYLGDGLLVYFSHPQAHEDDPQRAVRAGLGIIAAIRPLSDGLMKRIQARLSVRIGIHTGLVVVGEVGAEGWHEHLALGSTPNIAARLQGLAEPDTVMVSELTRQLTGSSFRFTDLGVPPLKGIAEPLRVWRVEGYAPTARRFGVDPSDRLTPMVGREQEIGLLLDRWQLAQEGIGQAALIAGEPGIGKSRLLKALEERLADDNPVAVELQCSPYYSNSAFYPIIACLQRLLDFRPGESSESRLDRIEDLIVRRYRRPIGDVKLIAPILSVPAEERYGTLGMTPKRRKDEVIRAMLDLIETAAHERPSLILFEDAHWADPSTLEVLDALIRRVVQSPLFLIITHRPEFNAPMCAHPHVMRIALPRLTRRQGVAIVRSLASKVALSPLVIEEIIQKTDGVPLFVEEVTKSVLETTSPRGPDHSMEHPARHASLVVPSTLRDSLMGRLDRVPAGKLVAQIGATIGREFTQEMVAAIAAVPGKEMTRALQALLQSGLILAHETPLGRVYSFKHALVQEVASGSLLKSTRQELHAKIARLLERRHPEAVQSHPELLAYHCTEARQFRAAVAYWKLAGRQAAARSANLEAAHHLERGLHLLPHLSDPERTQEELELCTTLGTVLVATKGYAAPEVEQTYARAQRLCEQVGDTAQRFSVVRGQCQIALLQAQYETAAAHVRNLLALAVDRQDSAYRLDAEMMFGLIRLYQGRFRLADHHLRKAILAFDPEQHREHGVRQGLDIGSACLAYHARVLWFLGYPERALERAQEAARIATQTSSMALGVAQAMGMLALVQVARRDLDPGLAKQTLEHATAQGIVFWRALGCLVSGWGRARHGAPQEGIREIEEGLALYTATGAKLGVSMFHVLQAEACQQAALHDQGLELVEKALQHVDATGESYYAAEAHRRRGELLLASEGLRMAAEAERCFERALAIARRQSARSWALRAATSLAQLWNQQGRHSEAYALLSSVHCRISEGGDTADVREAEHVLRGCQLPSVRCAAVDQESG